jgi:hypothetical protein
MKNIVFLLMAVVVIMSSCSKEESLETGGSGGSGGGGTGGGSGSGALLIKVVTTGAEVSTQDFTYDSKNLLSKYSATGNANGVNSTSTYTILRDSEGRVTKVTQDVAANPGLPANSASSEYYYVGPGDKKLKYGIQIIDGGAGFVLRDSVAYQYTGNVITRSNHYYSIDDGASYELFFYTTFKYDARGNVIEQVLYSDLGSGFEAAQVVTAEYDNKPNPCNFDDDAFLEQGMSPYIATNNVTKQTIKSDFAGTNLTSSGTYQYRSDGKPSKSTGTFMGVTYNAVFTYK